jgi:protein SCO1/2
MVDRPAAGEGGFAMKTLNRLLAIQAGLSACLLLLPTGCAPTDKQAGYAMVESVDEPDPSYIDPATRARTRRGSRTADTPAGEEWLTRFELTERSGRLVRSEDLKGQPYVVGFFFTLCPSICINQNAKVQELQEKYLGQPIRFLSISCDPEIDRPEVLAEYAKRFKADPDQWLFLTGDMDYITRVAGELYFLAASRRFHAEKFVLVDAEGNNVGYYAWADPVQFAALEREIDKLLAAGGTTAETTDESESEEKAPQK